MTTTRVPAREGRAFMVKAGEHVRITTPMGAQAADFFGGPHASQKLRGLSVGEILLRVRGGINSFLPERSIDVAWRNGIDAYAVSRFVDRQRLG